MNCTISFLIQNCRIVQIYLNNLLKKRILKSTNSNQHVLQRDKMQHLSTILRTDQFT
jgi:hypothetical protein